MNTYRGLILHLPENSIFVFGSNTSGIHGAGAAKTAYKKYGAMYGKGHGLSGQSYAIPTKDFKIQTLPLESISIYVELFIRYAKEHPELNFYVTDIGCGLAGYTPEEIAPMFKGCRDLDNVFVSKRFYDIIIKG